jgi:hypothetical protein
MLYVFGFERYGVVVSDLYFADPDPGKGQEGPERGVRLELRVLGREKLKGSIYSAQPIGVDEPLWRVDLLESAAGPPGSFDRTHHHPAFRGWEPGRRHFVRELSADPLGWLAGNLTHLAGVLERAGAQPHEADAADAASLREAVPEIMDAVRRTLDKVHAGKLGVPPPGTDPAGARVGWL